MKKGLFFTASLLLLSVILCLNCFATSDQYIYQVAITQPYEDKR
jgi:hypothetical protein